jgi:hypothetical protein
MWANCLRHLPDEPITVAELGRRARTGTNLDGMRRWLYVSYAPDPGRGKRPGPDATVTLTAAGRRAREVWQAATEETEARWRTRFGAGRIEALRAALEPLAAGDPPPLLAGLEPYPDNWRARVKTPLVLPHYPLTLHRGGYPDGA